MLHISFGQSKPHLEDPSAKDLDGDADPLAVREPLGPQELGGLWFQLEQLPDGALGHALAEGFDLSVHHGEVDGPHRVQAQSGVLGVHIASSKLTTNPFAFSKNTWQKSC